MATLLADPARDQANEIFRALLKRRSHPCVIVLDVNLNVVLSDPRAVALLETHCQPNHQATAIPSAVHDAIADLIECWARQNDPLSNDLTGLVRGLLFRVVPLLGPLGNYYAVFIENKARREDLKEAVSRYSLTLREVEVLGLILAGMNAAEIAQALHIAEVTVFDHFKHISHKTDARNRADMLAKVFNWQSALKSRGAVAAQRALVTKS
ncbi:MAG TPA: helix-turn-helix transcriptional regulator [Candidatus Limnocylindria bacterium]|nr:helix-turn-helix transcriptional regulator [Candidatus Limnocylindria bacterium]